MAVAFGSLGYFKLFTADGDCLARVGCFTTGVPWGFFDVFAVGALFGVIGVALLPVWLVEHYRHR